METELCQYCEKEIKFGIPEPTPIETKYKKYISRPTEPFWFHSHSGLAACDMTFAKPIVLFETISR